MACSIPTPAFPNPLRFFQLAKSSFWSPKHQIPLSSTSRSNFLFQLVRASSSPSPANDERDGFEFTPEPYEAQPSGYKLEKRRKAALLREGRGSALEKPEPPNYQIGWKRTKEIVTEKPKGFAIADFLEKLESLMGRQFGSVDLLAKTGEIVAERAREEAEVLAEKGDVDERLLTELFRVLRLMEMDLEMVKAAVKEETRSERIEQAKARCRQAILVALSF